MDCEEAKLYFVDLIKGKLSEEQEYRVRAALQKNSACQEEFEEIQATLEEFNELPLVQPDPSLKMEFYSMLQEFQAAEAKPSWRQKLQGRWDAFWNKAFVRWGTLAATAVLILWMGFWGFQFLNDSPDSLAINTETTENQDTQNDHSEKPITENKEEEKPIAEENEVLEPELEKEQVPELRQTIIDQDRTQTIQDIENGSFLTTQNEGYLAITDKKEKDLEKEEDKTILLEDISTNNRISPKSKTKPKPKKIVLEEPRAVNFVDLPAPDVRLQAIYHQSTATDVHIETLLNTVKNDPNTAIRLAAMDALNTYATDLKVQTQIIALLQQDLPAVIQMAVLDFILENDLKDAVINIEQFLAKENLHQEVKTYAEETIFILS